MKKSLKFTLVIMLAMLAVVTLSLVACNSNRRHTVTFQADGKVVDVVEFTEGRKIKEPAVPQKEHYTGNWESYTLGKDDITVYAVYTPIEYKITFVGNGQRIERTYNVETIEQFVAPEVPEKEHYTGTWLDYELQLEKNQVVNAVYTPIDYKITFVGNGQRIERTYNAETTSQFVAPEVPEKEHYTGTWQEWELQFEDNQIVNAVYTPIEYTATFDDGTKQTAVTYTIETKDEVIAPEVSVKEHYTGVWQEYELQFDNDQVINAIYTPIEYTATFDDGTKQTAVTYTVENANSVDIPQVTPKQYYNGYWQQYEFDFSNEQVIYADYTPIEYKITFVGNGQRIERTYNAEMIDQFVAPEVPAKEQYYGFDYVGVWEEFDFEFDDNQEVNALYTLETPGYTYMLNKDQQSYSLTKVSNDIEEAHVLPYYNDLPVTSIGNSAFSSRISLQTVTFEGDSQLQSIGDWAFYNCRGLTSIVIPSTVTSIGNQAFDGCRGLTSIVIPSTVTSIGNSAFGGCDNLQTVMFEDDSQLQSIGESAFEGCTNLQSVTFEGDSQLQSIGDWAFYNCRGLTSIVIPSTVISVGEYAFCSCIKLQTVTFESDSQLQSIGRRAFYNCSLISIIIPSTVTSIGISAFYDCDNLQTVTFEGDGQLQSIGEWAFYNCSGLTSIVIPSTVTSIGSNAFEYCINMQTVTFEGDSQLQSIGEEAFSDCRNLTNVYYGGTIERWCGIEFKDYESNPMYYAEHFYMKQGDDWQEVTEIVIPEGFEKIGDYQFCGFENITSITIPGTVTRIGERSFSGCSNLQIVTFEGESQLKTIGEWAFASCSSLQTVTFENDSQLQSIGSWAFSKCSSLTEITIPSTVINMGDRTFYECTNLQKVTFEGDSQLQSIGDAFYNCRSLISIVIPSTVTSIGDDAFYNCQSLQTVTFEDDSQLQSIGDDAFACCSQLTNIYYGGTIESWCGITFENSYANPMCYAEHFCMKQGKDWQEVTEIVVPESVKKIGNYQFYGFKNITSITIPSTVISIGNSAFNAWSSLLNVYYGGTIESWCNIEIGSFPMPNANHLFIKQCEDWQEVTEIEIPESVDKIGDYQFYSFYNITSITIPSTVTSIGSYAFAWCSKLTNVYYGGTIESWCNIEIGSNPMSNPIHFFIKQSGDWQEVTEIEIPETIEKIGDYQFYNFCNITSITIPSTVTSIGSYAFACCSKLTNVYYGGTIESWCNIEIGSNPMSNPIHFFIKQSGDWQEVTEIEIPETIEKIGNYQFYNFCNITSIIIPSTVTSIGEGAFSYCGNLTSVTIPSSVTSIGDKAFYNCRGLTSIVIPSTVTSIGSNAFEYCINMQTVTFEGDSQLQSIGEGAFEDCKSLTSIVIPSTVKSIESGAFEGCVNLQSVTFEGNSQLQSIGNYAFV